MVSPVGGWLAFLLFGFCHTALGITVEGLPAFIDADSLEVQNQKIRLLGIDAPEYSQSCNDSLGREYQCGIAALRQLKKLIGGQTIRCEGDEFDQYDRLLAVCSAGQINLNRQLVLNGWAVAFVKYDTRYLPEETLANKERRGLWKGEFARPVDYRAERWATAIQTSTGSVPPTKDCVIKGNINRKGDKIYHTPWASRDYDRTRIDTSRGERWFCSESEAIAAGWRPPRR